MKYWNENIGVFYDTATFILKWSFASGLNPEFFLLNQIFYLK